MSQYVADHVDGAEHRRPERGPGPSPTASAAVDAAPVVLVAQRLEREKDTDVAVRAFARIGSRRRGLATEIAGDGALRGELEELAASLGVGDAVEFLGSPRATCGT